VVEHSPEGYTFIYPKTYDRLLIYSLKEEYLETAPLYNRERGAHEAQEIKTENKPKYNYIEILIDTHKEELMKQTKGIDVLPLSIREGL